MSTVLALVAVFTILILAVATALYRWHSKRLEAELALHRHRAFHPTPACQFETYVKKIRNANETATRSEND